MISQTEWKLACSSIVEEAKRKPGTLLGYAAAYAIEGANLPAGEARKVQALYMLVNMSAWRGEGSKEARAIVKRAAKGE